MGFRGSYMDKPNLNATDLVLSGLQIYWFIQGCWLENSDCQYISLKLVTIMGRSFLAVANSLNITQSTGPKQLQSQLCLCWPALYNVLQTCTSIAQGVQAMGLVF